MTKDQTNIDRQRHETEYMEDLPTLLTGASTSAKKLPGRGCDRCRVRSRVGKWYMSRRRTPHQRMMLSKIKLSGPTPVSILKIWAMRHGRGRWSRTALVGIIIGTIMSGSGISSEVLHLMILKAAWRRRPAAASVMSRRNACYRHCGLGLCFLFQNGSMDVGSGTSNVIFWMRKK